MLCTDAPSLEHMLCTASKRTPHVLCLPGGSCSYDTTTITLSVLCYVPNKAPLADLQASYLQPAIRRQLSMLQHKIVQQGNLQPWTVFQVLLSRV